MSRSWGQRQSPRIKAWQKDIPSLHDSDTNQWMSFQFGVVVFWYLRPADSRRICPLPGCPMSPTVSILPMHLYITEKPFPGSP